MPLNSGFSWQTSAFTKALLLTLLYLATGKLGLALAASQGDSAVLLWAPSGIALGMLLLYGWRLWPGIFLGSLLLHFSAAGDYASLDDFSAALLPAAVIAAGASAQALAATFTSRYLFGRPVSLSSVPELILLYLVCGPLTCVVGASSAVAVLSMTGALPIEQCLSTWIKWWLSESFGVLIFLPIVLLAPGNSDRPVWRGRVLQSLPALSLILLLVPLGLTFYAWNATSDSVYNSSNAEFKTLVQESEKALLNRMDSYNHALLGGTAFYYSAPAISRASWKRYVDTIDIQHSLPGINGIGFITKVEPDKLDNFLRHIRGDAAPDFRIYPPTQDKPNYIISYIEPMILNKQALGLNIGFEANRVQAANLARDTGEPAITRKITLVQDARKTPGFLLLHPIYKAGIPHGTVAQRQQALQGWVYAPFIGKNFLGQLTRSQGTTLEVRVYDGVDETPENLIYSSHQRKGDLPLPTFSVRRQLSIMQQPWLLVWDSTPAFERAQSRDEPLFVLIIGLVFTALLSSVLLVFSTRRMVTMEWIAGDRLFLLPFCILLLVGTGSFFLYNVLQQREEKFARVAVFKELDKIGLIINTRSESQLMALEFMARRWEAAGSLPVAQWRADARNYISKFEALRSMQWIDASYHVRWIEPAAGNESAIGLDVLFDKQRRTALRGAAERDFITLTPPLDLIQGYRGIIAYAPLHLDGEFDGFINAIFSIKELMDSAISADTHANFYLSLSQGGREFFHTDMAVARLEPSLGGRLTLPIHDQQWELEILPTREFVRAQQSSLPIIVLFAGLLIGCLLAITLRAIFVARIKSGRLAESHKLNSTILSSTEYLIIAIDAQGLVMLFNRAAEEALGYTAESIIGATTPALWHDSDEVVSRATELSEELVEAVAPGIDVFLIKARREGVESREWTFIHKDGSRFPGHLTVTPIYADSGRITGYLGVIEDITERRAQQQALVTSEDTFRSAMEDAAIGMALVDPSGSWLKVNPALCNLLGYEASELLAADFQSITHPEELEVDLEMVNKCLSGEISTYQLEKRYFHRLGRIIWALLSVSLVRNSSGEPKYFISQIQDITEQKEMERMKSEFVSIVSHELRTPLTSIRGSLGLIAGAMAYDIPPKAKRLIDIAHQSCERLILLINDILDIDKIAAGQMNFNMKRDYLAPILHRAVEAITAYAVKFGVTVNVPPIDASLRIDTDEGRLIQVLQNLLSNAVKFSKPGDSLELSVLAAREWVRIRVIDQGPGIGEEFKSRIFAKFSQADSSATRSQGGTGLGLHISRQIVEQMGGTIGFDTEVGKGTTFWVQFSRAPGEGRICQPEDVLIDDPRETPLPRILHVEDDRNLYNVLVESLRGKAQLQLAPTLTHAREFLEVYSYDLVILDMELPDGSALELLPRLTGEQGSSTPVAILSASETPAGLRTQLAASIVKARTSEADIVATILKLIQPHNEAVQELN